MNFPEKKTPNHPKKGREKKSIPFSINPTKLRFQHLLFFTKNTPPTGKKNKINFSFQMAPIPTKYLFIVFVSVVTLYVGFRQTAPKVTRVHAESNAATSSLEREMTKMAGTVETLRLDVLQHEITIAVMLRQQKEKEEGEIKLKITAFEAVPLKQNATEQEAHDYEKVLRILRREANAAKSIAAAQYIIEARIIDDIRAIRFPHLRAEREAKKDYNTFLHKELPDSYDPMLPMVRKHNASWNYNAVGLWAWTTETPQTATLMVLGGFASPDTVSLFLSAGYVIWRRTTPNFDDHCREEVGYLTYLSDDLSPAKPESEVIAFIHGHKMSWHQLAPLMTIIADGIECQKKIHAYVPLDWHGLSVPLDHWGNTNGRYAKEWNRALAGSQVTEGDKLVPFCCGQFAVSKEMVRSKSVLYYTKILEARMSQKYDAYSAEFFWHIIFGAPEEDLQSRQGIPKICQKPQNLTLPLKAFSRTGQWTKSEGVPRVTIVLGHRNASDEVAIDFVRNVTAVFPEEYNIWVRSPIHICSQYEWRSEKRCGTHRGYLSFLNDLERPASEVYVFIKGESVPDAAFVAKIAERIECAMTSQRYTPLHDAPHQNTSREMGIDFGRLKGDEPKEGLRAFAGEEFVVPRALVPDYSQQLQNTYEHFLFERHVGKQVKAEDLTYFWHWFLGEKEVMTEISCAKPEAV